MLVARGVYVNSGPDSARSAPLLGRVPATQPFGQRNRGPGSAALQTAAGDNATHPASWTAVVSLKIKTQDPQGSYLCSLSKPSRRAQRARTPPKPFAPCSPAPLGPIPADNESYPSVPGSCSSTPRAHRNLSLFSSKRRGKKAQWHPPPSAHHETRH